MKIRPLTDYVVIRRDEAEKVSKGGIIIPEDAKRQSTRGEVLEVGPGKVDESGELRPVEVKAGDRVIFLQYVGNEVTVDGEDYIIVHENDILAVEES